MGRSTSRKQAKKRAPTNRSIARAKDLRHDERDSEEAAPRRSRLARAGYSTSHEIGAAHLLRRRWHGEEVVLCAFDLTELDGRDMRRVPIEDRKAALAKLLWRPIDGIAFNEHYTGDGAIIYRHACALGCEGIVSKRVGSAYRGGRAACRIPD